MSFKRVNIKVFGMTYNDYILIETLDELEDYFNDRLNGINKDSLISLFKRTKTMYLDRQIPGHSTDPLIIATEIKSELSGAGYLISHAEIFGGIRTSMIKMICRGDKLVINSANGISHFPLPKKEPYEIEILPDDVYSIADIRVFQWPDGKHWYAKVSQIDVVIDGEQKWNARWVAQEKAEQFLNEMLQKSKSHELAKQKL